MTESFEPRVNQRWPPPILKIIDIPPVPAMRVIGTTTEPCIGHVHMMALGVFGKSSRLDDGSYPSSY